MPDYSRTLGDTIRRARAKLNLTQSEVAESIDVDVRTVLNIENYKGNPKMEVLYPLIRCTEHRCERDFLPGNAADRSFHYPLAASDRKLQ